MNMNIFEAGTEMEEGEGEGKGLVLLSGGLDSATALYWLAQCTMNQPVALSIDYGQSHSRELMYARKLCAEVNAKHIVLQMHSPDSALTNSKRESEIPDTSYADIEGVSPAYVPFRNGLMLSHAAAVAVEHGCNIVVTAVHGEDALNWAYPDCTPEFIGAMANAMMIGTYGKVRLVTPFQWFEKDGIVDLGSQLGVPYQHTWSCYRNRKDGLHCGTCPTCLARQEAFKLARVEDPTTYAKVVH